MTDCDVVVFGAGAAGLAATRTLLPGEVSERVLASRAALVAASGPDRHRCAWGIGFW